MISKTEGTPRSPITTVVLTINLFRQPPQTGEVIDHKGHAHLVIGIQNFRMTSKSIVITYTCQSLETGGRQYPKKAEPYSTFTLINARFKHDSGDHRRIALGGLTEVKGKTYKIMEYVRIYLKATDIHVDALGKEIHPVDNETLKKKRLHKRMEDLSIELY